MKISNFQSVCIEYEIVSEYVGTSGHVFIYAACALPWGKGRCIGCFSRKEVNSLRVEDLQAKLLSYVFLGESIR